jgi:hypothetical protein
MRAQGSGAPVASATSSSGSSGDMAPHGEATCSHSMQQQQQAGSTASCAAPQQQQRRRREQQWPRQRLAGSAALVTLAAVAALLSLAQPVLGDVAVLSKSVLPRMPLWARNRTADVVMDFSKADPDFKFPGGLGTIHFRNKAMKVRCRSV